MATCLWIHARTNVKTSDAFQNKTVDRRTINGAFHNQSLVKRFLVRVWGDVQPGVTDVRVAIRPAGRLSAALMSSAAPKKKAFDRGGLVWPPGSNAADDRFFLGGGWGDKDQNPQPKFFQKIENLQTAEKSRGWLEFRRFLDQINCVGAN